jgi:hypothetical protein
MFKYDEDEANKEVTITITKGELARVYAVMGALTVGELTGRMAWDDACNILDKDCKKYDGFIREIPYIDRLNYSAYQHEWLSILFPVVDEKTQKINELEQIINDAKAKIEELKL